MEIQMIAISELKPFIVDGMPPLQDGERRKLKESIERKGIEAPVILSEDLEIIDGNHRVEICKELSIAEIPYRIERYKDVDSKKKTAYQYQIARRNLKTHQSYWMYYCFWKQFGVEHGKTGGIDLNTGEARLATPEKMSQEEIAGEFGVHKKTIVNAVRYGKLYEYCQEHGYTKEELDEMADKGTEAVIDKADKLHQKTGNELPVKIKKDDYPDEVLIGTLVPMDFDDSTTVAEALSPLIDLLTSKVGTWDTVKVIVKPKRSREDSLWKRIHENSDRPLELSIRG